MYGSSGRPSVPPKRLLRATVLIALCCVRCERMFCEQLGYNMLFRWFLDIDMTEKVFPPTVFVKNRGRLMRAEVAEHFLTATLEAARKRRLLSSDHFSVDATQI